ncbi:MAG: ATP-binding protein [Anaerolineae bacterium]|nr:ATP-binding protein [Anaerolineae bacterium]
MSSPRPSVFISWASSAPSHLRELEFLLRRLNVPLEKLDQGSVEVGATADVLTAYRAIAEAGGIVIAAHANSANGVAMWGFDFGGQTRIAYTQDPNLHALEVTDLDKKGPRTTARSLTAQSRSTRAGCGVSRALMPTGSPETLNNSHYLGIGDRVTEILLPEVSFQAIREVFLGDDFTRTRPYRPTAKAPFDYIQAAREEGPTIVQDFHERFSRRGGHLYNIVANICAFANTNGGTLYIGLAADPRQPPLGISNPRQAIEAIRAEVARRITPPLEITADVQETQGKKIVRVMVPRGSDPPYAVDDNKIYVRSESETGLAVRDEIVNLVRRALTLQTPLEKSEEPRSGPHGPD